MCGLYVIQAQYPSQKVFCNNLKRTNDQIAVNMKIWCKSKAAFTEQATISISVLWLFWSYWYINLPFKKTHNWSQKRDSEMKDVSFLKYFNFIKNSVLYLRLWENNLLRMLKRILQWHYYKDSYFFISCINIRIAYKISKSFTK